MAAAVRELPDVVGPTDVMLLYLPLAHTFGRLLQLVAADVGFTMIIIVIGFLSVVGVLVSGALGAERREDVMPGLFQSLWLSLLIGTVLTVAVYHLGSILALLGQGPEVVALATPFARTFSLGVLPLLLFTTLRGFVAALMRTRAVFLVMVATFGT